MSEECECGKKKYDWLDKCWSCKEKEGLERIWEYFKDEGEVTNEDKVLCPYCGHHYGEDGINESCEVQCDECDEDFKIEVEYSVSYSTYQTKPKKSPQSLDEEKK